jgi:hypothetical protein
MTAASPKRKASLYERIKFAFQDHPAGAGIMLLFTAMIGIAGFVAAISTLSKIFTGVTDPPPPQPSAIRETADQLKNAFDAATVGRDVPVPEKDFARVDTLVRKIEQVYPDNGHVIYYKAFKLRWRNQRAASHTLLFWYLDRSNKPNDLLAGDDGDARHCFDNWLGYCKQRQAYINHVLALDLERAANEEKNPAVALERLRAAHERAQESLKLYKGFNDPAQGDPTKVLEASLRKRIGDATKATEP